MNRRIKSTRSRLWSALRERLRKEELPSIDSMLRSLAIFGVLTPEHLGAIHKTSPRSVLRVLKGATELKEPLVRPVGPSTSGPLQQCYLPTQAGREKVGCNPRMKFEFAQRPRQAPRLRARIYMAHRLPHGQTWRTPDLIITPDGVIPVWGIRSVYGWPAPPKTDGYASSVFLSNAEGVPRSC
jgi:hypothetical protein